MTLLKGLMLGFFFPIVPIFFFRSPGLFSKQTQMGIVAGSLFNLGFGTVQWFS
jgi:hypothetical protein